MPSLLRHEQNRVPLVSKAADADLFVGFLSVRAGVDVVVIELFVVQTGRDAQVAQVLAKR